jgi:hypothetical protein
MAGAALSKLLTLCSLNPSGCMGSFVICTGYSEQKAIKASSGSRIRSPMSRIIGSVRGFP